MSYSQTYRTLFELQVLHEYYLNDGPDSFRGMDPQQQQLMFKNYAFNGFLQVIPTTQTRKVMENQKLLLHTDKRGLQVIAQVEETAPGAAAKPFIPLADDVELHFLVKINDPAFEIYTDLTLVKNELFFFSNILPPDTESGFPFLPTAPEQVIEPLYISNAFRLVYSGGDEEPNRSQEVIELLGISREEQIGLLGVVVLRMKGVTHNITNVDGKIPANPINFVMEFANRSTIWKYYFQNSDYYAETTSPKPLTRNGYNVIGPQHLTLKNKDSGILSENYEFDLAPYYYPAPDVRQAEIEAGIFYSVIYI